MSTHPELARGKSWVLTLLLVLVAGTIIGLFVYALKKAHEAAAQTQSINNLKQIGLGMQSHHDTFKRLPFNGSDRQPPDSPAKYGVEAVLMNHATGSWAFQIMPFTVSLMDHYPRCRELDFPMYLCPGRGRLGQEKDRGAWTDYFINNYLNDPENVMTPDNADVLRNFKDITDGAANTIFAGHGNISTNDYAKSSDVLGSSNIFLGGTFGTARGGPNWRRAATLAVELRPDSVEPPDFAKGGWGGPFSQGALFCFCDGSVRLLGYETSPQLFGALLTPTGND